MEDPAAARLLADPARSTWLAPFLGAEATIGEAAGRVGAAPLAMYRFARALEERGVLRVARETPRRGRAVKHYRCVRDALFVPYRVTPAGTLEALLTGFDDVARAHLIRSLADVFRHEAERVSRELGLRLFLDAQGRLNVINGLGTVGPGIVRGLLAPEAPAVWNEWVPLRLTRERAKALQHLLNDLAREHAGDGEGAPYLLRVALVPVRGA